MIAPPLAGLKGDFVWQVRDVIISWHLSLYADLEATNSADWNFSELNKNECRAMQKVGMQQPRQICSRFLQFPFVALPTR